MNILEIIKKEDLNDSFIAGYYGGGNLGDELFLEVTLNLLQKENIKRIRFYFKNPELYQKYHLDFPTYTLVKGKSKLDIVKGILSSKNLIVCGGGLWGVGFNRSIFILSLVLFLSRIFLNKDVYLLHIGYYHSTNVTGHLGALLSFLATKITIARDEESYQNFKKFKKLLRTKQLFLDKDLAFYIKHLDKRKYYPEIEKIEKLLRKDKPSKKAKRAVILSIKSFSDKQREKRFFNFMLKLIEEQYEKRELILLLLIDLREDESVRKFVEKIIGLGLDKKIKLITTGLNPVGFYYFLQKHSKDYAMIAPQYHSLIAAYLANVPFLPVSYDNKCTEFLKNEVKIPEIKIRELNSTAVNKFLDKY